MKMFALFVSLSLALSCGSGGGVNSAGIPEAEACNQAASAFCTKIFGCTDGSSALVKVVLVSEANCRSTVLQYCGSTGFQCSAGATYHGDEAQMCKDQFNTQDCAMLSASLLAASSMGSGAAVGSITAKIPACMQICTGAGDGGAG